MTNIEKTLNGFIVTTEKGTVHVSDVIVTTNGYSTNLVPWLRRRIIPIGSHIIATEELPERTIDTLRPTNRIARDACEVLY